MGVVAAQVELLGVAGEHIEAVRKLELGFTHLTRRSSRVLWEVDETFLDWLDRLVKAQSYDSTNFFTAREDVVIGQSDNLGLSHSYDCRKNFLPIPQTVGKSGRK